MLNKIIEFSIRNKLVVGLFVFFLLVIGIYETGKLPIDAVPDITNNQVQVITVAPSFGATDIERLVTFPVEQAMNNIAGLKEIRSFSRFGLSLVTIVFEDETDIYMLRQQVAERLQKVQAQIPPGIGIPEMGPITTGLGEIYQYVVRAKEGYKNKYNETELRTIQDWIVRRQLLGVKGVAEVSSIGGKLKQIEIAIDPNKLQSFNITINDVFNALEKNNQNTGGAYIEKGATVLFIRSEGLIGSVNDIENITIKSTNDGSPLFVRDVAEVNTSFATRYGALGYNDEGEVAGAVVMMLKGANSSEVIKNIKERIEQIKKTLPEGVFIEPFLDRTKMVNNAIGTVEKNLLEGALIVVFVLVLFLGNLRAGLLVASVIPLAMLFAIILMNLFGVSGNLMSLGALDFGLIVDGAVIIVEAVMHQLTHSKKFNQIQSLTQAEMDMEVKHSAGKMMNSAVFGQIIILVVYLPIFSLQGIEGKMFKPMAQTVAFALLGAFVLSLTYIPMMSALLLSKKIKHTSNFSDRIMIVVEKKYQQALCKILAIPKAVLLLVGLMFISAIIVLSNLGGEFIPALEEGDFAVESRVLTGSNLNTTLETTQQAARILKKEFPEVLKVVSKIGSGEVPTDPMPMEAADMMVILKDKAEWVSASNFNELAEKMGNALHSVPGLTVSFQFPVQMRFNELMTGAKQDVVCKIFGENLDTLSYYAQKLGALVNGVEGAKNLYVEAVTGMPQVIISYKRAALAEFKLSISDVNRVINTAFAGQSAGMVFEDEKRFDVVVRLKTTKRKDLEDVKSLLIPTPIGNQVPLYQLANVEIKNGPNQIQREDAKRRIVVGFNTRGRDVQSIVNELKQKTEQRIKLPSGYYVTYGGTFENLHAAKQRLMVAVPVSLLLIFLLLFFAFGSVKQGLLIYSAIPLSAIGGIFFLAARGMPFSISAGVGFIALFGIAVLNGIVLIAEFNRLKEEGWTNLFKIVVMGTKVRLRPVLMTAFVASLGFLPMAISNGAGAEVQRPLATVVIGGLMIATLLTLFVLPVLYVLFEAKMKRNKKKKNAAFVFCFVFAVLGTGNLAAQEPIGLKAALDTALKNNRTLKSQQLKMELQQQLIKTAASIPATSILGEYGQINSVYNDKRIGISQAFNFPTVYTLQKKLLTEEWRSAVIATNLKKAETEKTVCELFYAYLIAKEKKSLLSRIDSIYLSFVTKSKLRLANGETNSLEKMTAEAQRGNALQQLVQLEQEIQLILLQFRLVLNSKQMLVPFEKNIQFMLPVNLDTSVFTEHPSLLLFRQQKAIAQLNVKNEQARLLPDFNLSYSNMSMQGTGADNENYNSALRFQSIQLGLGIPLFYGAQKARIKSNKINLQIAENAYAGELAFYNGTFLALQLQYEANKKTVLYYETQALLNAKLIQEIANKQLSNGDIDYLSWGMLTNQAISIQAAYIEAIKQANETAIQLNFLMSK